MARVKSEALEEATPADVPALTCTDVGVVLGVTRGRVSQLENAGRLRPALVTRGGMRLFTENEVQRFLAEREVAAAARRRRKAARRGR